MRDLTRWIGVRFQNRRPAIPHSPANGIPSTVHLNILAKSGGHAFERTRVIDTFVGDITRQAWPLRQARLQVEQLASANRHKDEFLAMLSRELRSPLASIHYAAHLRK